MQNITTGLKNLIYICSRFLNQKKQFFFLKFCENLSKISRFKSICSCLNSTNSTRAKRDIYSNPNPILYNKIEINSNKHYSNNLEFADNNNRYSPNLNHCNLNKIIYFSNEKENQKNILNNEYNNSYYSKNSKSLYFNNKNLRGNYSCYCLKDKSNNNDNRREIIINNNSHNNSNSHGNNLKERRCISKIKLSSNKINDPKFYCKNNSFKNNNSSILKYSHNIVNKSKKIYIDKNNYKYMSSNNISLPKKANKCQNINYVSFYNDNIPFNKDYSNKNNNIFSERIHYRSYKTILNDENNNENIYINKNNTFLDQQILDYLNNNYEEKNNLIKKMKNQKIEYYKKSMEEQNILNKNYTHDNDNINKNNKTKIITLNNLNNYSYINNNYNYYCNNNYNNDLLISKNYNSNKKSLYPNYSKNRIKKSVNKKCNMRISNYTNENINTNNIMGDKCLLNKKYEDINHPLNNTSKNIIKNKIFNSFLYDNNINSPKKYKIMKINDKKISPSKIYKEDKNNNTNNNNINNNNIKNNCKKINLKGKFETITGYHSMGKLNMNQNKNKMKMNKNKNVIQKSLTLFFYNNTKHNNKNEKNENIIPIERTLNINISIPKSEKIELMKDSKISLKNSKRKMRYKIIHKKCNSISGNINNKKIRKIKIYNNIPQRELNGAKNKDKNENMKDDAEKEKGKENESLLSLQSMNDSKILELANKFIIEEEKFNKDEIIEILNTKKENNKG